jgi:hypothetical protein
VESRFLISLADPIFDPSGERKKEETEKSRASPHAHRKRRKEKKKRRGKGEEEEEERLRNDITTVSQSSGVYHPTDCIQD